MASFRQRVLAGSGANAFGQAITIGIQLFSLPFFLHYWDAATYGTWLILSAIPAYLSMADVGMVTAAGNKMTMAMGRNDPVAANRTFQSATVFMLLVCGALFLLLIPATLWLPIPALSATADYRFAVAALSASVLLALFGGLAESIFKASNRYPLGTLLGQLIRLTEWAGYMLGLYLVGSFGAVAAGGLTARILGLVVITVIATRGNHGISWGTRHADWTEFRSIAKPAMSFMLLPLSFALSFQGVTILVGQMLGPVAVALFNTYRTLARVSVQLNSVLSHALWPEFSRMYGAGNIIALKKLYRLTAWIGLGFALLSSGILYFMAPWILNFWTHGVIIFYPLLMLFMLAYAAVSAAGHVARTLLIATNKHDLLAIGMVIAAILLLLMTAVMIRYFDLMGAALAMVFSELAITLLCMWLVKKLITNSA